MKRRLRITLSLLIVLIAVVSNPAQEWRKVTTHTFPGISGIFFATPTTGWAVGANGFIYKSTDAGNTWDQKFNDADSITYLEVFFLNENLGYAGGKYGNMLKTIDGGENWERLTVSDATGDVKALYVLTESQAWALINVGSGTNVYYTSNGGTDWSNVLTIVQPANDMHFSGSTNGIVVGKNNAEIYYTSDGVNWTTASPAPLGGFTYTRSDLRGVYMVSSTVAYSVGWGSLIGMQPSIHIKTTDGGATWSYLTQSEPNRTFENLYSVYFKDANNGLAIGGGGRGSVAVRTTDGGANWIPINIPCGSTLSTITGTGNNVWVCGGSGVILRSTNFGDSWDVLTPVPGTSLYSIQYLPNGSIVASGFDGVFLKSTNAGASWKGSYIRANNVAPNILDMHFVDENIGYASHSYGLVTKTTDGGETWAAVIPDTISVTVNHNGVFFLNENYGFTVGRLASNFDMINKTTDGGSTWQQTTNIVSSTLRSIAFVNENTGIAVGEKLKSIYTSDGGTTWNVSIFETLPPGTAEPHLRKVTFKDNLNATAVGESLILNSTNAGATWNYADVNELSETLTDVDFKDAQTGWAVGTKTSSPKKVALYKTTDGGLNWTDHVDTLIFPGSETVYGVSIHNDFVWICGSPSNIFTDEPVTSVTPESGLPIQMGLGQNYPNPFNPATKISFTLSQASMITIKVYDILGREIKSLIQEFRSAGEHVIEFDAKGLSSGIYLYVLRTESGMLSKKMTLMK